LLHERNCSRTTSRQVRGALRRGLLGLLVHGRQHRPPRAPARARHFSRPRFPRTTAKIGPFKARICWTVPWYSSFGSDFNYDFHATTDEAVAPVEYNYQNKATLERKDQTYHLKGEQPGASIFLRDDDRIFHAFSTYGRGMDLLVGTYNWLDHTPFGRQEDWED
jgi:predicted dithiol-disulfide oxidoreductase (DUF899 family)